MKYIKLALVFTAIGMLSYSCSEKPPKPGTENSSVISFEQKELHDTDYRPNVHFTPKEHWMNDPNGMFYLKGVYHLFFQYYPDGNTWGPMHWGHATSKDLVTWEEQPIALAPDDKGYIFSGSAVVDTENTSGFGTKDNPPVIAMFTYHDPQKEKDGDLAFQSQAIAYSLDQGKTWTKYSANPVIENPGIRDFRDPKMVWDAAHKQWVMVLAAHDETWFYVSKDLKKWTKTFAFGKDLGAHGGVWECPDFFPMSVEGSNEVRWVLIQSLNPGGYNGGSGTQYFVGDFDGTKFTLVDAMKKVPAEHTYWLDFGKDNYAGVTFSNIPKSDGRTIYVGWMANWEYAQEVPTKTWRSAMTLPRELKLFDENGTYRLRSQPVKELYSFASANLNEKSNYEEIKNKKLLISKEACDLSKCVATFTIPEVKKSQTYGFELTSAEDTLKFGFEGLKNRFFLDRSHMPNAQFHPKFAEDISYAPRLSNSETLQVTIVLDKTSIEIFYDNGETVMTEIFFPKYPLTQWFALPSNESFRMEHLKINQLKLKAE